MPQTKQQKVLEENRQWQMQLIEAFGICPFAKQCRQQGQLERDVLDDPEDLLDEALTRAIFAHHLQPDNHEITMEIVLLICPNASADAAAFERLVRRCGDRAAQQVRSEGLEPRYYVVAFHPLMAYSSADPQKLVGFWRRAPHPTVQLVHIATLNQLRTARQPAKYVDPADLEAVQALLGQDISGDLADRIALANWRTYHANEADLWARSAQVLVTSDNS